MSAVVEPEISFQAELYGEATHEVRDRPTDGPSICTFVKPAGPRASEGRREETSRPFGPSRMAVVTTGPAAAVDGRGRPGGGRSGRFSSSSMRALLLVQSHSSPSLPLSFGKGRHLAVSDVARGWKQQDLNFYDG